MFRIVPPSILLIPLATVVFKLGLFDTRWALILTYPTFLIPFCTWLLMGYFRSIPFELEECALHRLSRRTESRSCAGCRLRPSRGQARGPGSAAAAHRLRMLRVPFL